MDEGRELSDFGRRLKRVERKRRPAQQAITAVSQSESLPFVPRFLAGQVTLWDETITAAKPWTDSGAGAYTNGARYAILWVGIKDTTDGIGQSYIEVRGGGSILKVSEIYEPASDSPQNGFNQVIVPLSAGSFDFRVVLAGGASNLLYRIDIQGYIL